MSINRIKDVRKSKGITQQELAEKVGLSQGQIARLEAGTSEITLDQLNLFAKALDCEPWELMPLDMQPKINPKDLELIKLLKALTNSADKMDNSANETKAG